MCNGCSVGSGRGLSGGRLDPDTQGFNGSAFIFRESQGSISHVCLCQRAGGVYYQPVKNHYTPVLYTCHKVSYVDTSTLPTITVVGLHPHSAHIPTSAFRLFFSTPFPRLPLVYLFFYTLFPTTFFFYQIVNAFSCRRGRWSSTPPCQKPSAPASPAWDSAFSTRSSPGVPRS